MSSDAPSSLIRLGIPPWLGLAENTIRIEPRTAPPDDELGLLVREWVGPASLVSLFRLTSEGLRLHTALPSGDDAVSDAFPVSRFTDALRTQVSQPERSLDLPGPLIKLFAQLHRAGLSDREAVDARPILDQLGRDRSTGAGTAIERLIAEGALTGTLDELGLGSIEPWWPYFDGSAVEIRLLLPPTLEPIARIAKLEFLLVGPQRARVPLVDLGEGNVRLVGVEHGDVEPLLDVIHVAAGDRVSSE